MNLYWNNFVINLIISKLKCTKHQGSVSCLSFLDVYYLDILQIVSVLNYFVVTTIFTTQKSFFWLKDATKQEDIAISG